MWWFSRGSSSSPLGGGSAQGGGGGGGDGGGRVARASYWGLVLVVAASGGLNLALARRVREYGSLLSSQPVHQPPLSKGALVPPIVATGLDGQLDTITYAARRDDRLTVLYVFTPPCVWCARNMDNFKALLKAKGQEARFVGLSLSPDSLAAYVHEHELTALPVLTKLSAATMNAYRFGGTPQTLVISPEGRVVENWSGAWTKKTQTEIEAFFHVTLPGLHLSATGAATAAAPARPDTTFHPL